MTDRCLLVDAHVHVHEGFAWPPLLDAAAANFARARRVLHLGEDSPGCLMLCETQGANRFEELWSRSSVALAGGWEMQRGEDGCSIVLSRRGGDRLDVVAGRQIRTGERLEVLALGCRRSFQDGRALRDLLRDVVQAGATAVVPWGLGKWLGRRGEVLRELLAQRPRVSFCLGDNGGRPRAFPRPTLFQIAERVGIPVLPGSDPLPMRRQMARVGSYGFVLDSWHPTARPAEAIRSRIDALRHSPPAFGDLSSLPYVIGAQVALRWRHRRSGTRQSDTALAEPR